MNKQNNNRLNYYFYCNKVKLNLEKGVVDKTKPDSRPRAVKQQTMREMLYDVGLVLGLVFYASIC